MGPLERERILAAAGELDRLEVFERIGSTSTYLKELAAAGEEGCVAAVAAAQDGGRGRMGRSFFSPEGTGVYLSLLVGPELSAGQIPTLTAAAAVGVCRALEDLGSPELGIKWVNDLISDGKKVCGILAESVFDPADSRHRGTVVGVGINLFEPQGGFPAEIAGIAGSVFGEYRPGLAELAAGGVIREMLSVIKGGDFLDEYRRRQILPGREALLIRGGSSERIRVLGLEDDCRLRVRFSDGREESVCSGEVSLKMF